MGRDTLVILETIDEAKLLSAELNNSRVLCFHPNIQVYLKDRKVEVIDTHQFISFPDLMDKDNDLAKDFQSVPGQLPETYFIDTFLHYLCMIRRHFLFNIEVLSNCFKSGQYKEVVVCEHEEIKTGSPWVEDEQLYLAGIVKQLCQKQRISYRGIKASKTKQQTKKPTISWLDKVLNRVRYLVLKIIAKRLAKQQTLLVPGFGFNLGALCQELQNMNPQLKIMRISLGYRGALTFALNSAGLYDDSLARRYLETCVKTLESQKLVYQGVDFGQPLINKVKNDLLSYMLDFRFKAYGLGLALKEFKPSFILSQMDFGINNALGYFAKQLNIPSVLISHGSHVVGGDNKYAQCENTIMAKMIMVGDYNYCAVQSPYARELALKLIDDPQRVVNVKPVLWGKRIIKKQRDKAIPLTLVHAGSFKLRHNRWYIYGTSDEFLQELRDLSKVVATLPGLKLILRVRPDIYELSLKTVAELVPLADNITIKSDGSFQDILKETDLLISYSSTTIEEALNNKIPVLQYGGEGRYCHIPCQPFSRVNEVNKAVSWARNKEELKAYLTALVEQKDIFSVPDQEFAKHVFADDQAVDFSAWFSNLIKSEG